MCTFKTELVTKIAYLIGVKKEIIEKHYGEENREVLDSLYQNKNANTIRYLCKLRTKLM